MQISKERRNAMSAEENKAMIRRMTEEVTNKGNLAVADEIMAPTYVSHTSENNNCLYIFVNS